MRILKRLWNRRKPLAVMDVETYDPPVSTHPLNGNLIVFTRRGRVYELRYNYTQENYEWRRHTKIERRLEGVAVLRSRTYALQRGEKGSETNGR